MAFTLSLALCTATTCCYNRRSSGSYAMFTLATLMRDASAMALSHPFIKRAKRHTSILNRQSFNNLNDDVNIIFVSNCSSNLLSACRIAFFNFAFGAATNHRDPCGFEAVQSGRRAIVMSGSLPRPSQKTKHATGFYAELVCGASCFIS